MQTKLKYILHGPHGLSLEFGPTMIQCLLPRSPGGPSTGSRARAQPHLDEEQGSPTSAPISPLVTESSDKVHFNSRKAQGSICPCLCHHL